MAVFRVERNTGYTVMSNHHLRNKELSLKAKGLLSQMLSLPEDWDYTLAGLSHINREKIDAIREAVKELEKAGYIVRSRERDEKGRLRGADYVIYEQPQPREPEAATSGGQPPILDLPTLENPTLDNPTLEKPTQEKPTLENPTQLNTKRSKTNSESKKQTTSSLPLSIPSPSLPAQTEGGMEEDQVRKYRNQVKRNIDYFEISEDYAANLEQLDEIVDLMVETLCSTRPTLSVAGDNLPASLVKERLLKINCMHIQYVMDSLKSNTTPVRNIKRYLLTVLFNAPATIDHYYSAQFRHEYYQQAQRSRAEG